MTPILRDRFTESVKIKIPTQAEVFRFAIGRQLLPKDVPHVDVSQLDQYWIMGPDQFISRPVVTVDLTSKILRITRVSKFNFVMVQYRNSLNPFLINYQDCFELAYSDMVTLCLSLITGPKVIRFEVRKSNTNLWFKKF